MHWKTNPITEKVDSFQNNKSRSQMNIFLSLAYSIRPHDSTTFFFTKIQLSYKRGRRKENIPLRLVDEGKT